MATLATPTSQNDPPEQTNLKVFSCDGIIITSPSSELPSNIDIAAMGKIFSDPPYPRECRRLCFFANAEVAGNGWVEWRQHMWFMKDEIYEGWQDLEVALATITQEILQFSKVTLPLEWEWFPLPSNIERGIVVVVVSGSYLIGVEKFKKSIMLACDAFMPLMAICSFTITMTQNFRDTNPPWARRLLDIGVHPSFVQELKVLQIADFDVDRIGTFVKENCGMQPYIDRYLSANVPVWFVWHSKTSFIHHKTRIYCPTDAQVVIARQSSYYSARQSAGPAPPLIQSLLDQPDVVDVPSSTEEPTPFHRPFPSLLATMKPCMISSREMDQARRRNREGANASHQLPGKAGAHVFIWENVDGYLICKKLDRKEVECDWGDYMNGQRKYNMYFNEWDLAKEFAPEEDAAAGDDDDEPVYYSYMGIDDHSMITLPGPAMDTSPDIPLPSPPTLPPVLPALTPQSLPPLNYSSVLDQVYDPPTPITWLEGLQSLELVVYNRYGFTWRDRPTPYDRMATLGHSLLPECWETTRKICFLDETISVPPSLWDLSTTSKEYVFNNGHKRLRLLTYGQDTVAPPQPAHHGKKFEKVLLAVGRGLAHCSPN
ncbi:hypothetical protein FIBSPDRAFT_886031 [Athelia psychrophila]|uniref:Uncharacterized protein n=1 Tax=Athelia psychrophila TaxID=1759441 RepID=A0A166RDE3_9AGAM|nr:hypothetical protein FIBSPDRAFT_886031 [Fibularhizoctonia sp. CBS 109695]